MQLEDLLALLPHGETVDLDWKRTFPPGYFDKSDRSRYDSARAEVVKDVAAMANAASERVGHLVYGIADQDGQRVVWPDVRTHVVDEAVLAQFLTRYLDPAPGFEYTEFQHEGQLVGLLRVRRVMPYPHVVRESLGQALGQVIHKGQVSIHRGQIYVRKGTLTEIALYADLVHMMEGRRPWLMSIGSPEANEIESNLRAAGWELSWPTDDGLDLALSNGYEHVCHPGTRRRIEAPTSLRPGLPGRFYLMQRRLSESVG